MNPRFNTIWWTNYELWCQCIFPKKDEKQLEAVYKIMHTNKLEPPLVKFHLYFDGLIYLQSAWFHSVSLNLFLVSFLPITFVFTWIHRSQIFPLEVTFPRKHSPEFVLPVFYVQSSYETVSLKLLFSWALIKGTFAISKWK